MTAKRPFGLVWKDSLLAKTEWNSMFKEIADIIRSTEGIELVLE